jgi:hypothetical protein
VGYTVQENMTAEKKLEVLSDETIGEAESWDWSLLARGKIIIPGEEVTLESETRMEDEGDI